METIIPQLVGGFLAILGGFTTQLILHARQSRDRQISLTITKLEEAGKLATEILMSARQMSALSARAVIMALAKENEDKDKIELSPSKTEQFILIINLYGPRLLPFAKRFTEAVGKLDTHAINGLIRAATSDKNNSATKILKENHQYVAEERELVESEYANFMKELSHAFSMFRVGN
jgi:hypothetical protein